MAREAPNPAPLLLASGLSAENVAELLEPYAFEDQKRADANIQVMAGEPRSRELLAKILGELLVAVSRTADPDQATKDRRGAGSRSRRTCYCPVQAADLASPDAP